MSEAQDTAARAGIDTVVGYYDTHPINEQQILKKLDDDGISLDGLTEATLKHYDQDHFGGLEAVDVLAEKAGIGADTSVLDVCSGVGGPARYLADRYGCRVTGLDVTASRHATAERLTRLVGLGDRVDFRCANALDMPFADAGFDVVIGQEAWAHVPDKPRLIAECARVAKPGGRIAFTDIVRRASLTPDASERLRREMTFLALETIDGYADLLSRAGCEVVESEDLGALWAEILRERLAMYRSLQDTTVAKFGEEHFQEWDRKYAFFVGLFGLDQLAGVRMVARRLP